MNPPRSRLAGLALFAVGMLCVGVNQWTLSDDGSFYPKLYIVSGAMLSVGMFGLATGLPQGNSFGTQSLGYRALFVAVCAVGAGLGVWYSIWLGG